MKTYSLLVGHGGGGRSTGIYVSMEAGADPRDMDLQGDNLSMVMELAGLVGEVYVNKDVVFIPLTLQEVNPLQRTPQPGREIWLKVRDGVSRILLRSVHVESMTRQTSARHLRSIFQAWLKEAGLAHTDKGWVQGGVVLDVRQAMDKFMAFSLRLLDAFDALEASVDLFNEHDELIGRDLLLRDRSAVRVNGNGLGLLAEPEHDWNNLYWVVAAVPLGTGLFAGQIPTTPEGRTTLLVHAYPVDGQRPN